MSAPIHNGPRRPRRRQKRDEEGFVILIVMIVLLLVAGVSVVAFKSSVVELRASGQSRQAAQARYLAEGGISATQEWVDFIGPEQLNTIMQQTTAANGDTALNLYPLEPPLVAGGEAHRLYTADLTQVSATTGVDVIDDHRSVGFHNAYEAELIVDITDVHRVTRPMPGMNASGHSQMTQLTATVTARGRFETEGDDRDLDYDALERLATGADARAHIVTRPFMQ